MTLRAGNSQSGDLRHDATAYQQIISQRPGLKESQLLVSCSGLIETLICFSFIIWNLTRKISVTLLQQSFGSIKRAFPYHLLIKYLLTKMCNKIILVFIIHDKKLDLALQEHIHILLLH